MLSAHTGFFDELALCSEERRLIGLELSGGKLPDPPVRHVTILPQQAHALLRIDGHYRGAARVANDLQLGPVSIRQHHFIGRDRDHSTAEMESLFFGFHGSWRLCR